MMRLNSDLVELCEAALAGNLHQTTTEWNQQAALGVVMAAGGYPDAYQLDDIITGLPTQDKDSTKVFHAGTKTQDNAIVTAGGRVLCVCALGETIADAQTKAYQEVKKIHWDKAYYRTDIGFKAIQ